MASKLRITILEEKYYSDEGTNLFKFLSVRLFLSLVGTKTELY